MASVSLSGGQVGRRSLDCAELRLRKSVAKLDEMSDFSAEIGLLEGERMRRFAKAATALCCFEVSQMFKLDRHERARFVALKRRN